jgi:hypothetical protein
VDSVVGTIQYVHSEVAGHMGGQGYCWQVAASGNQSSNLQREVEYVADRSGFCQKIANRRQDDGESQPKFNEIMEVGEEWSLDTIGPLPVDESGSTCIMVAIDGFSWFVVLEPASNASGESVAHFCSNSWVGSADSDQREFARTVDRSLTIISSMPEYLASKLVTRHEARLRWRMESTLGAPDCRPQQEAGVLVVGLDHKRMAQQHRVQ